MKLYKNVNNAGFMHILGMFGVLAVVGLMVFVGLKVGKTDAKPLSSSSKSSAVNRAANKLNPVNGGDPFMQVQNLGDGKVSTVTPQKGYVYSCSSASGGGGATKAGNWIVGTQYYPSKKLHVSGDVAWPSATVNSKISGSTRLITSNDLPDHHTGTFPITSTDAAYAYDTNPNAIKAQTESYSLPVTPVASTTPSCLSMGPIGIMTNGVLLFNALDAQGRDAVAHEVQDACAGHPQAKNAYHYHGYSPCFKTSSVSTVIGYAVDGYGITGPKKSDGSYYATNDLDICHGISSTITWDGKQVSMYHYVMTADYPYSIGCLKGSSAQASAAAPSGTQTPTPLTPPTGGSAPPPKPSTAPTTAPRPNGPPPM